MSDPFIPASLVPPGINDQRGRDFAAALGDVLSAFSTSALLIQNPLTVDARLLPILTVELGMTEFMTAGLKEIHVRELLARAPEIHAWTGTVFGTRRALGALGITVDWTQWWQKEPKGQHDTHTVIAYVNDNIIDGDTNLFSAATQYAIRRVIEATQRWSQEIEFLLGARLPVSIGAAAAVRHAVCVYPTANAAVAMPSSRLGVAPIVRRVQAIRRYMAAFLPPDVIGELAGGGKFVVQTSQPNRYVISQTGHFVVTHSEPL